MDASSYPLSGTNAYARRAAAYYDETAEAGNTMELSYTDLKLAAQWGRYHSCRWHRRAAYAAVLALVAALCVGVPDVNGDGRVSLADLGAAVRIIALGA